METFDTRDFYLAVALFSLGHELVEIENTNPRRAVFRFEHDSMNTPSYFLGTIYRKILEPYWLISGHLKTGFTPEFSHADGS
jgi:hypothetical protein